MAEKQMTEIKMTTNQLLFASNYMLDRNIKFTSQRTGIPVSQCYKYRRMPKIKKYILQKQNEIAEKCDVSAEMVLNELKRIAFYDIKEHIKNIRTNTPKIEDDKKHKSDGEFGVELKEFDEIDGRAIAEVHEKVNKDGVPELKIKGHSKMEALKVLADWFKGGHGEGNTNIQFNFGEMSKKSAQEVCADYREIINGN